MSVPYTPLLESKFAPKSASKRLSSSRSTGPPLCLLADIVGFSSSNGSSSRSTGPDPRLPGLAAALGASLQFACQDAGDCPRGVPRVPEFVAGDRPAAAARAAKPASVDGIGLLCGAGCRWTGVGGVRGALPGL